MLGEIFSLAAIIAGILLGVSYFPQAYKIHKTKDSKNISLMTYWLLFIGTSIWLAYGIFLNDISIILGFIVGAFGAALVLFLTYRNR